MNHSLLGKIAFAALCLNLSVTSFAQENVNSNSDILVQKQKLEVEQKQLSAVNADMLTQKATLNAELAQVQSNFNRLIVTNHQKVDPKDLKSKEISMELPAAKSAEIFIENNSRNLEIKVWDQQKVKVVTTILYDGDASKITDAEWFEKINLTFRSSANTIRIKTGASGNNFYRIDGNNVSWGGANLELSGTDVFVGKGKSNKTVTIYIPKENNLDLESKYAEVIVDGNLNKLNADITNGGLEMGDVSKLYLKSKYSNVSVGNTKMAEVDLINGRFIAKDADELDLDTKYATIETGSVKKLMVRSTNDEYEIEEVGSITCRKNYGNLRITKLNTSMDLDGTNADIKVRNIGAGLEYIKINDKYADIRLPMRNVKNYNVTYLGAYSTVYAAFEKKPAFDKQESKSISKQEPIGTEVEPKSTTKQEVLGTIVEPKSNHTIQAKPKIQYYTMASAVYDMDGDSDSHFTATVGEGKGAKLDLKCQNCTVDFK
jgi:hypothetical protein